METWSCRQTAWRSSACRRWSCHRSLAADAAGSLPGDLRPVFNNLSLPPGWSLPLGMNLAPRSEPREKFHPPDKKWTNSTVRNNVGANRGSSPLGQLRHWRTTSPQRKQSSPRGSKFAPRGEIKNITHCYTKPNNVGNLRTGFYWDTTLSIPPGFLGPIWTSADGRRSTVVPHF
jgi:hypothetical protein